MRKDKNTKIQPKKTRCETVNFGSIKFTQPKTISRNTSTFIILLYFILTYKELTFQQL